MYGSNSKKDSRWCRIGAAPYELDVRLVPKGLKKTIEFGKPGKKPFVVAVPLGHRRLDTSLWLTSLIAQKFKEFPDAVLAVHEAELRRAFIPPSESVLTVCLGRRREARLAQLLHLDCNHLDMRREGPLVTLRTRSVGERFSPLITRDWLVQFSTTSSQQAELLEGRIALHQDAVIAHDESIISILATSMDRWLAVGLSLDGVSKYAAEAGIELISEDTSEYITLAFRARRKAPTQVIPS